MISGKRRLVILAGASLLASGCTRYTRYRQQQQAYEARHEADLAVARTSKTVTLLVPRTDRAISLAIQRPVIPMREHVAALEARKAEFEQALRAATASGSFAGELADMVALRLEGLGYTVKTVVSDELTATRQALQEAEFPTDLIVGLTAPQVALRIVVANIASDQYFLTVSAGSSVVREHRGLALGARRASPALGDRYISYLRPDQMQQPEAVRWVLQERFREVADGLVAPFYN